MRCSSPPMTSPDGPAGKPSPRVCAKAMSVCQHPMPSATMALSVEAVADRLGMPLMVDEATGIMALGPESAGRALTTADVPDIELPDRDGNPFKLSSLHGRKVLLVAWASW